MSVATVRQDFSDFLLRASTEPHFIARYGADARVAAVCAVPWPHWQACAQQLDPGARPADARLLDSWPGEVRCDVQCVNTRTGREALSAIMRLAADAHRATGPADDPPRQGHTIVTRHHDTGVPVVFTPAAWIHRLDKRSRVTCHGEFELITATELRKNWRTVLPQVAARPRVVTRARVVSTEPHPACLISLALWRGLISPRDLVAPTLSSREARAQLTNILNDAELRQRHTPVHPKDGVEVVFVPSTWLRSIAEPG